MQTFHGHASGEIITPFEWRRYRTQADAAPASEAKARRASARNTAPQSAEARAARILAHRWGNPYSRPGWP